MASRSVDASRSGFTFLFIYGPPAVGKLTVAKSVVAVRPAFKLFHNHVVVDTVAALFPFGHRTYFDLVGRFRRELIEAAARHGLDLVITYAYALEDEAAVEGYSNLVRACGGQLLGVQLTAPPDTLAERVSLRSRRAYGKLNDAALLRDVLARWDFSQRIPNAPTLSIDTTVVGPADAASRIIEHYGL
jgi:hypothetical protein